jgi:hypothetical protein
MAHGRIGLELHRCKLTPLSLSKRIVVNGTAAPTCRPHWFQRRHWARRSARLRRPAPSISRVSLFVRNSGHVEQRASIPARGL